MPASTDSPKITYLSLAQASHYIGVHEKTLRRRIADGNLTAYRMAGSRLIRVKSHDLDALFRVLPTVGH